MLSSVVAAFALSIYACAPEDENPATNRPRGTLDSGVDPTGEDPTDTPVGAPLCGKYGGYENVKTIANEILENAKADCRINGPILALNENNARRFKECFEVFIGSTFQCPEATYVGGQTKVSNDRTCRNMVQAHQNLNLRRADFEAFVEAVAAGLRAKGVSDDDIRLLAPSFEGTRNSIVRVNNQPDRNTHCACPNGEYMGKECTVIVDASIDVNNDDGGIQDASDDG